MTKLVVDSSVAVKWFVVEPYSAEAHRILDEYQNGNIALLAPDLVYAEIGNIVWKKYLFQGLDAADAQDILKEFQAVHFDITPAAALLDDAYQIAVRHRRTVYDALYLALGQYESCQMVMADEKFVNAVGASFLNLIWLANWP